LLPQFKRWYSQAGTPQLTAGGVYDAAKQTYHMTFMQNSTARPGQAANAPFVIPVSLGLVGMHSGAALPLYTAPDGAGQDSHLLVMSEQDHEITFYQVPEEPVPSVLRGFSAPVVLHCLYTDAQLLVLLAHDTDPFNRWEAGQRLALRHALAAIGAENVPAQVLDTAFLDAMRQVLRHPQLDAAFKELTLTLPSEAYMAEQLPQVDPQRVHAVREAMRLQMATSLQADWQWAFQTHHAGGAYRPDAASAGKRALAGQALVYLCLAGEAAADATWPQNALACFHVASNMTDRFNALHALVNSGSALAAQALAQFHALFKHESLVIDKWFSIQASTCDRGGQVLREVRQLLEHPDFTLRNPNRARSLISAYCNNPGAFHRADAAGYVFWSKQVADLDSINPQVAARLARSLDRWTQLGEPYRSRAREALLRVAAKPDLSNDVREVIDRALSI
jgi:aminopeptidase N